ncbi:MAG: flippase [Ignavibacteria bacterium]|nr:flippase [Ignavibacteria bacterium]
MAEIKQYWFPSGIYTLLQNVVLFISGIASFIILVRFFDKQQFGAWALYLAITTFADMARGGLVNNALIKFSSVNSESNYQKILTASLHILTFSTLLGSLIILILAPILSKIWNSEEVYILLNLYPLYAICQIPHMFLSAVEQARFNFKGQYHSNLIRNFFFLGLIAYFTIFLKYLPIHDLPFIQAFSVLLAGLTIYLITKDYVKLSKSIDWSWVKRLLNFGKYVFGSNVSSILFTNIDQIMIGYYMGPSPVAVYNTAMRIGNFSDIPMSSVASIVYPKTNERLELLGKDSLRYLYERSVGLVLAFVIPGMLLIYLFTKEIILIVASEKYLDAIPVIYLVLIFSLFKPFSRQFSLIMDTLGKPKVNFQIMMIALVFNFCLNLFLIPKFGLIGAAIASILSLILVFVINQIILYKELKVKFYRCFKYMLLFFTEAKTFLKILNELKTSFKE